MPAGTDDDIDAAHRAAYQIQSRGPVIALSASGSTPCGCETVRLTRQRGAAVIAITNNPATNIPERAASQWSKLGEAST